MNEPQYKIVLADEVSECCFELPCQIKEDHVLLPDVCKSQKLRLGLAGKTAEFCAANLRLPYVSIRIEYGGNITSSGYCWIDYIEHEDSRPKYAEIHVIGTVNANTNG